MSRSLVALLLLASAPLSLGEDEWTPMKMDFFSGATCTGDSVTMYVEAAPVGCQNLPFGSRGTAGCKNGSPYVRTCSLYNCTRCTEAPMGANGECISTNLVQGQVSGVFTCIAKDVYSQAIDHHVLKLNKFTTESCDTEPDAVVSISPAPGGCQLLPTGIYGDAGCEGGLPYIRTCTDDKCTSCSKEYLGENNTCVASSEAGYAKYLPVCMELVDYAHELETSPVMLQMFTESSDCSGPNSTGYVKPILGSCQMLPVGKYGDAGCIGQEAYLKICTDDTCQSCQTVTPSGPDGECMVNAALDPYASILAMCISEDTYKRSVPTQGYSVMFQEYTNDQCTGKPDVLYFVKPAMQGCQKLPNGQYGNAGCTIHRKIFAKVCQDSACSVCEDLDLKAKCSINPFGGLANFLPRCIEESTYQLQVGLQRTSLKLNLFMSGMCDGQPDHVDYVKPQFGSCQLMHTGYYGDAGCVNGQPYLKKCTDNTCSSCEDVPMAANKGCMDSPVAGFANASPECISHVEATQALTLFPVMFKLFTPSATCSGGPYTREYVKPALGGCQMLPTGKWGDAGCSKAAPYMKVCTDSTCKDCRYEVMPTNGKCMASLVQPGFASMQPVCTTFPAYQSAVDQLYTRVTLSMWMPLADGSPVTCKTAPDGVVPIGPVPGGCQFLPCGEWGEAACVLGRPYVKRCTSDKCTSCHLEPMAPEKTCQYPLLPGFERFYAVCVPNAVTSSNKRLDISDAQDSSAAVSATSSTPYKAMWLWIAAGIVFAAVTAFFVIAAAWIQRSQQDEVQFDVCL